MLFLLNHRVLEVETPEALLLERWRTMGCGDPRTMRAQQAIDFVTERFTEIMQLTDIDSDEAYTELAALIVAKTGANSLVFKPTASGRLEPRLQDLPQIVLQTYLRGAANDGGAVQKAAS